MDYYEFFEACQTRYPDKPTKNLKDLTFRVLDTQLPVAALQKKVEPLFNDKRLRKKRSCAFKNTDHLNDDGLGLVRNEVNEIADKYLPTLERDYFGTYLLLMQVQLCKSRVTPGAREVVSEHWHIDDFPPYSHKIFVYLSDVVSDSGPLLVAKRNGNLVLGKCTRTGPDNWSGRTPRRCAGMPKHLADCAVEEVLGCAGTVFVFNQHIWHRRSLPKKYERYVLVFNFRPYIRECRPYFGEHTTPWTRYPPVRPDPVLMP